MNNQDWVPVTYENCGDLKGPFYHGTKYDLKVGDLLVPGFASNFEAGRISNNVYFSALLEPAVWGAELATALAGMEERGRIYIVEATGPFEDDPNLTNKRFAGNPTQSYRTRHPLKIVGEVQDWQGHPPEVLQLMLDSLKEKMRNGLAAIED
ncbi:rifampin ADP-ribosylating transferase [Duganella sp. CF402]|uniref:NAD(+)--rifampin ADP-ribosyltransferase n=1 Tax=unclassified Duganella TaxID=2636909 RepID=UPI0008D49B56|nr:MULTISPECIES: NAD(+)--rifampin ADP-ribosyltransferase [unclassified Duganella]RZT08625.1 rifampin ADP-ribosylating transferase [Duganella sp. BK701]SEL87408.1 rifampin ADP-ribosylating transferase [Duganella sp. CF402]